VTGTTTSTTKAHIPFGDRQDAPFYGRDIVSVRQFSDDDLAYIFGVAHEMQEMVARIGAFDLLKGKLLANLFYEPSTRTSSSFTAAMERLGGSVIPINEVTYSSVSKGESLADTVRSLEAYADVTVLRHPDEGASALAAQYTRKPIINAGDGVGEHPTQALLDLFTILEELGSIHGKTISMVGDLKYGRTVHSLARLLSRYDVTLNYVSPEILRMPEGIVEEIEGTGTTQTEYRAIEDVIADSDVVYVTRVQKERFENPADYETVAGAYVITPETMGMAKARMALMHPLPRVNEISMDVDDDPRAAYFRQMEYGMYVRMALLALVLGKA
jgi:aspartate carbamoyltransferase